MSVETRHGVANHVKIYDYDYDKTLKKKTKDLQLLDQQIAALDGVTDAESRAMKARLEAQREQAQEDLDDTVKEHTFKLQVDGLDELKTELQENYDNYIHDLNGNLDKIVSAVDNATSSVNGMLGTVSKTIKDLLDSYGVKGLTADVVGLKGYASGTRRAGRNGWALTNERGGEMVITDRGIYMPLSQNSGVVPADLTSKIFGLTENYSAIMGGLASEYVSGYNKANDGRTIAPVVNCPITITGNQIDEQGVIRAINKQMPVISKKVQSDIRKDLNKSR